MQEILPLFCISLVLAYCSQKRLFVINITQGKQFDLAFTVLVLALTFFCGLRVNYNDTYLYLKSFTNAPTVSEYLNGDVGFFDNPLFYLYQSFFRHSISDNRNLYLMTIALFTIYSLLRFIKKHSVNLTLSVVMFFSVSLYYDCLGAMKQMLAIAILTYAVEALFKNKYTLYLVLVILATLFHAYAIFFLVLLLFTNRPWTVFTYVVILGILLLLLTFDNTIEMIMSAADETGKNLAEEELMDNIGINPFRLLVFAIPGLLSFVFQERLNVYYDRTKNIITNMSILSFLVMLMGIFTAANLFGRCAGYFAIGSVIILPWIIQQIFAKESISLVSIIVGICYFGFFIFLSDGFDASYKAIGIGEFFMSL